MCPPRRSMILYAASAADERRHPMMLTVMFYDHCTATSPPDRNLVYYDCTEMHMPVFLLSRWCRRCRARRPQGPFYCAALQAQVYPPWAASYLDYKLLKERIKDILAVRDNPEAGSVLSAKKNIFQVSTALAAPQAPLMRYVLLPCASCCNTNAWPNIVLAAEALLVVDGHGPPLHLH